MRTERAAAHTPVDKLVPVADRAFPIVMDDDDSEKQTIWENNTDSVATLTLHVETPKPGRPPRTLDERRGTATYRIQPGTRRALPSKFDRQIQLLKCNHVDCLQKPFDCESLEEGHEKSIAAGLGPQLKKLGSQRSPIPAGFITLEKALDDVQAREKAAEDEEYQAWRRARMEEKKSEEARIAREKAAQERAEREDREAFAAERQRRQAEAGAQVDAEHETKRGRGRKAAPDDPAQ